MAENRDFNMLGVWATDAETTIPATPVVGESYRRTALTQQEVEDGWDYALPVDSADFNQALYLHARFIDMFERQGIATWNTNTAYVEGAICIGSNNNVYQAVQANTGIDPTTDDGTNWEDRFSSTVPDASETVRGIIQTVTQVEANDGVINTKAITPLRLKGAMDNRGFWDISRNFGVSATDLNNISRNGLFYISANAGNSNTPDGLTIGLHILVSTFDTTTVMQFAVPDSSSTEAIYVRKRIGGIWQSWEKIETNFNGTVSLQGSRTSDGTWTLTGLTIGKPLYLIMTSNTTGIVNTYIRATSGTNDGQTGGGNQYNIFRTDSNASNATTNVSVYIPTATSVSFSLGIAFTSGLTINAYQ